MAKIFTSLVVVLFTYSSLYWDVNRNTAEYKLFQLDSIAGVEYAKNIVEITPNRHPELRKYYASAGINPDGAYAWCGFFLHYCHTSVGIPGKGGWAASWVNDKRTIVQEPKMGYGFGIRKIGRAHV